MIQTPSKNFSKTFFKDKKVWYATIVTILEDTINWDDTTFNTI